MTFSAILAQINEKIANVIAQQSAILRHGYAGNNATISPVTSSNPPNHQQSCNQSVDPEQVKIAKAINSYNKKSIGFRGKPSDAPGSCVQATLDSVEHAQKLLGTDSSKIIGNNIGAIANSGLTSKFQGRSMKDILSAFQRCELKVGDTLSLGGNGVTNIKAAQNSGQSHHALTITYLSDNNGNLILGSDGKPQIGFLDNTAGKQTISWSEFESRYSGKFSKILEIGRPSYGKILA